MTQKCLVLCLLLVLIFPVLSAAEGNWQYYIREDDKLVITGYNGWDPEPKLKWNLDGHMVAEIGPGAFAGNETIVSMVLPVSVRTIGDSAFAGCTNLQQIVIPELTKIIGEYAFADCYSLESVNIPDRVVSIGEGAFDYDTEVICAENTQGYRAAVSRGFNVASREEPAAELYYREDDYQWKTVNGEVVITSYVGSDATVYVPDELDGCPVTTIADSAFSYRYEVEHVYLPETVTTLERRAFLECHNLLSVSFPESLQVIGQQAFYQCYNLREIELHEGLTTMGEKAFEQCRLLSKATLPASLTTIPYYTFFECDNKLTIRAPEGSAAQTFARQKGYQFEALR